MFADLSFDPTTVPDRKTDISYVTTSGLPHGLVSDVTVYTGRDTTGQKTVYSYVNNSSLASHGKVSQITEAAGTALAATTTFTYNSRGLVQTSVDPAGRTTTYYYDLSDRLIAVLGQDPDGTGPLLSPLVRYDYDVFGNVLATETVDSYIDPANPAVSQFISSSLVDGYTYDAQENLTGSYEQRRDLFWYLYTDSSGNLQRTNTYTTATSNISITNAVLATLAASNSSLSTSNPAVNTYVDGHDVNYTYDYNANLVQATEFDGTISDPTTTQRKTFLTYDRLNQVLSVETPDPITGTTTVAGEQRGAHNGFLSTFIYDNLGNLISQFDALGHQTKLQYDDLNRLIQSVSPSVGGQSFIETLSYAGNEQGWKSTVVDAEGRSSSVQTDLFGRPVSSSGETVAANFGYWGDGQVRSTQATGGPKTSFAYDAQSRLSQATESTATNSASLSASYGYSIDGLVTSTTDAMGRVTTFDYDQGGRLIKQTEPDPDGAGSLLPAYTVWIYDSLGNTLKRGNALNDPATVAYNAGNQPERYILNSRFEEVSRQYSERNYSTVYEYDVFGNVSSVTDASTNKTTYGYNALDQRISDTQVFTSQTPNLNLTRSYSFDGVGNVRSMTDRNGRTTEYAYDELDRLTQESWKSGATTVRSIARTYDKVGNTLTIDDSDPASTDFLFAYDTRDRLQLEQQSLGTSLTGATGGSMVLDRDYDSLNNRLGLSTIVNGAISTSSNLSTTTTSPVTGGVRDFANSYVYDGFLRLNKVVQSSQSGGNAVAPKQAVLNYQNDDQISSIARYKSTANSPITSDHVVTSSFGYDSAGRLNSLVHSRDSVTGSTWNGTSTTPSSQSASNVVGAYFLNYDRDNRISAFSSYQDAFKTSYVYYSDDEIGSSTNAAISGLTLPNPIPTSETTYVDGTGNRYINNVTGQYSAPLGNHNRVTNDGTYTYQYDNEGNITVRTETSTGKVTEYTWDYRNRLTRVVNRASVGGAITQDVQYTYDAFDRKVGKQIDRDGNGSLDSYCAWVYDGEHAAFEYEDSDGAGTTANWRLSNRFLYGNITDMLLSDEQYALGAGPTLGSTTAGATAGLSLWTLGDQLGSIRDVVDNNGIDRQHVVYSNFGERLLEVDRDSSGAVIANNNANAIDELFGYTGRDWDSDTKLQYNRARWYDAKSGRWMNQDPIGFAAGDANLYRYVRNEPMASRDPSGLITPGNGHHILSWSIFIDVDFDPSVKDFFNGPESRLAHDLYKSHNSERVRGISECDYRAAVREVYEDFMKGRKASEVSIDQARALIARIKGSNNPLIKNYLDGVLDEIELAKKAAGSYIRKAKRSGKVVDDVLIKQARDHGDDIVRATRKGITSKLLAKISRPATGIAGLLGMYSIVSDGNVTGAELSRACADMTPLSWGLMGGEALGQYTEYLQDEIERTAEEGSKSERYWKGNAWQRPLDLE